MRILIYWDDAEEAELIGLFLNVDDNFPLAVADKEQLFKLASSGQNWDVLLMATSTPDVDSAYEVFAEMRRRLPDTPVVGASRSQDVYRIAKFISNGMRAYVIRDESRDYMFLLQATLDSVVQSVLAEREQWIASKLREEIESVRKLQESIIPNELDSPDGYKIAGRYEPSQIQVVGGRPVTMAGGDYYDVFTLADGSIVILVGDASGHGMKACMSIMTMHTLVRMIRGDKYRDTAQFVGEVNRRLCEQTLVNDEGGFITLLYAILNPDTEELQWTSAGHPIPILQNMETNEVTMMGTIDDGGLPLAIVPEADYDHYTHKIPPKHRLLIYTDGLEEAFPEGTDGAHTAYGIEGIMNTMRTSIDKPINEVVKALFSESNAFTKGSGRHDDTSIVLVERFK